MLATMGLMSVITIGSIFSNLKGIYAANIDVFFYLYHTLR
jgi:hypothetical protein